MPASLSPRVPLLFFLREMSEPRRRIQVAMAAGIHLFPFRTEKLSPPAPMVLGDRESRWPPSYWSRPINLIGRLFFCRRCRRRRIPGTGLHPCLWHAVPSELGNKSCRMPHFRQGFAPMPVLLIRNLLFHNKKTSCFVFPHSFLILYVV